jgi:hypothetical protein
VIQVEIDWTLKKAVLEEIKLQAEELLDTKHGPKVLQKLKAIYPRIFVGVPVSACQASENKKTQGKNRNGQ